MSITAMGSIQRIEVAEPAIIVQFSTWCHSRGKRALDLFIASVLVVLLLPISAVVALLVRLSSRGPVLFRQLRAGYGTEFELLKFRTMLCGATGPGITQADDVRITSVGRWLRAWKLDELPQLWNVVRGDMSLVGPRPDLTEYWWRVSADRRRALGLMPGITGPATLKFQREEEYLKNIPPQQLTDFYCEHLLPRKIDLELQYATRAGLRTDIKIIAHTALALILRVDSFPRYL